MKLVSAKGSAVAKVLPLYPSDEGHGVCRIEGLLRTDSVVQINDTVTIQRVKTSTALHVQIKGDSSSIDMRYFNDALEYMPIQVGSTVAVPYFGKRQQFSIVTLETEKPDTVGIVSSRTVFDTDPKEPKKEFVPEYVYCPTEQDVNSHVGLGYKVGFCCNNSVIQDRVLGVSNLSPPKLKHFSSIEPYWVNGSAWQANDLRRSG